MTERNTTFFSDSLQKYITSNFMYLNQDLDNKDRIFFDNAGGSLRLKPVVDIQATITSLPDSSEQRSHDTALYLQKLVEEGTRDIRRFFNAEDGVIATSLTASKLMFEIVTTVAANSQNKNIVTTALEHPSSYDACEFACNQYNHELKVANVDPISGSVPISNLLDMVDEETILVSIVLTSNITGAMHDIKQVSQEIKRKNPNAIIVVDGVQGAPHGVINVKDWEIDAINIAPYKMFGNRGVGFAYLSDRIASLPHHRLLSTADDNWKLGSTAPANFASFTKVVDYICEIGKHFNSSTNRRTLIVEGMKQIHLQEQAILNRLVNGSTNITGIKNIPKVKINFEQANGINQDLILALTFENVSCEEAVKKYEENGIIVYARKSSSHLSKRILEATKLKEMVRVSPIHCHTKDDVDEFLKVTKIITEYTN